MSDILTPEEWKDHAKLATNHGRWDCTERLLAHDTALRKELAEAKTLTAVYESEHPNPDGLCQPHLRLANRLKEYPQEYGCPQCAVNQVAELQEHKEAAIATIQKQTARIAALEAILANAEHAEGCASKRVRLPKMPVCDWFLSPDSFPERKPCNCFKSLDPLFLGKAVMAVVGHADGNPKELLDLFDDVRNLAAALHAPKAGKP